MLDILKDYLVNTATPEFTADIERATAVFEDFGIDNYENQYEELIMTAEADDVDTGDTVMFIDKYTRMVLFQILAAHAIVVEVEAPTRFLCMLCEAIRFLQEYENTDELIELLDQEKDEEETFADLVSVTTMEYDVHNILVYLESIDPAFLKRLRQYLLESGPREAPPIDAVVLAQYVTNVRRFRRFTGNDGLITFAILKSGASPGFTFETYLGMLGRNFEAIPKDQAVLELIAMALISSDGYQNPHAVIKQYLETVVADSARRTAIDVGITETLVNFQTFISEEQTETHAEALAQPIDQYQAIKS